MAGGKSGGTAQKVYDLAKPLADELGLILWDVRFEKEGATWYLRVLIDKEGSVDIDDCEAISRPLDKLLDETDPIDQSYVLEVGSPGLARDLKKPLHFEMYKGKEIKIRFFHSSDSAKEIICVLKSFDKDSINIINLEGEEVTIKLSECAFIRANDDQDLF